MDVLSSPHLAAMLAAHLPADAVRVEALRRLLTHMLWADQMVSDGLERSEGINAEAWQLYAHVLGAEQIWLARILATEAGPVWPKPEPESLGALRAEVREGYASLLTEITDDELGLSIAYTNTDGDDFETSVEDIIQHVFLHGAYHRGQIALLLRNAGDEPVPTDFIAFARGAAAATSGDDRGSNEDS